MNTSFEKLTFENAAVIDIGGTLSPVSCQQSVRGKKNTSEEYLRNDVKDVQEY